MSDPARETLPLMESSIRPGALTKAGAARYLSVSVGTFLRIVEAGGIPRVKDATKGSNSLCLFRVCDLDKWLADNLQPAKGLDQ